MAEQQLLQLAQVLERLGAEEWYYVKQPAGVALNNFLEKQREVLITAEKLSRELAFAIRFNPERLMGIDYPLDDEIESISELLEGLEEIKHAAVHSIEDLPSKTETFAKLLDGHLSSQALNCM
ncbi:MAG: hypothetical protein ACRD1N_06755 [Terriglobia bacterium]